MAIAIHRNDDRDENVRATLDRSVNAAMIVMLSVLGVILFYFGALFLLTR